MFKLLDSGKYSDVDFVRNCLQNYEHGYSDTLLKNIAMDMNSKYNLEDKIIGSSEKWLIQGIKEFLRQKELGKSF